MNLLVVSLRLQKVLASFRARRLLEENDREFSGIKSKPLGEWVSRNNLLQIGRATKDDLRAKAKLLLDCALDAFGQSNQISLVAPEDDVAALYVRLWVFQAERCAKGSQGVHLDLIVAADVDAAEHADNGGHLECDVQSRLPEVLIERARIWGCALPAGAKRPLHFLS